MKNLIKKVLNPIKKVVRGVGGFFGRVMNKLGPLGMIGMMFAMPYLSNFWATMGNAIGGTAAGGTAAATAGAQASATAVAEGTAAAGSSAASNIAAEAGKEAAKKSLLQEGSGKIAAKVASKYASGTGQATGLFAGGTASKALGYTLKTLHNTASLGMNIFNTVTGAVSGALDFVSGGSLTKLGNWVGDRFGDFQTRMGMATSEGYKKRLGTRLSNGDLTDSFLEIVKNSKYTKGVYAQHSHLYPEGVYTPPAETLISKNLKNLPSLREQIESGSLLASNDPDFARRNNMYTSVSPEGDITQKIDPTVKPELVTKPATTPETVYDAQTISAPEMTINKDSLLVDTGYGNLSAPDISGVETYKTFGQKLKGGASNIYEDIKRGIVGGERTVMVDEYAVDTAGVSFPTGRQIEKTVVDPNIIERASSAAGDAVANLPKRAADQYGQTWIDRKLGNVPEYKKVINYASEIPGITYGHDSRNDFTTELPRNLNDETLIVANNYNNLNQGIYSPNPFAVVRSDRPNIDYGQGGIYGS